MPVNITSYPLNEGEYRKEVTTKTHVVWHGTMGRTRHTPFKGEPGKATSSIDGWNTDSLGRVGATYLVDRDGTIYQTIDEKFWISHLGIKQSNGVFDQKSVGIELANELCLLPDDGKFYAFGAISKNTEYVGPTFEQDWRDFDFWAKLDEPQVDAAIALTLDICARNNIEPKFFKPSTTFDHPGCFERATILCHSNCRKDKSDLILQDWVWDKIAAAGIPTVA